jgi:hypothetical protein
MDTGSPGGVRSIHNSKGVRDAPPQCRKESVMCYEFSEWSWKLRAAELARKEREAREAAKKERKPAAPAEPTRPEPRVEEPEKVPA